MTRKLSRTFPIGHIREGQPTHFVEKFLNTQNGGSMQKMHYYQYINKLHTLNPGKPFSVLKEFADSLDWTVDVDKKHTIRLGNSIKDGQMLQFAVWSGKPYASPEIKIWEPVRVGVQDVVVFNVVSPEININGRHGHPIDNNIVCLNDGLNYPDFISWFKKASGPAQIIHWTNLRY